MSRKMVLVPEAMLLELKGKLPKYPEFQAIIALGHKLDQIQGREDQIKGREVWTLKKKWLSMGTNYTDIEIIYNKPVIRKGKDIYTTIT